MTVRAIAKNKAAFALFVLFAIVCFLQLRQFPLVLWGDGEEYAMQTIAVQRHLSFGINLEDIQQAEKDYCREAQQLHHEYYDRLIYILFF